MGHYAHLVAIENSAVSVKMQTYLTVDSFTDELKVKEDFLLNITKLCEELNIHYANPHASSIISSNVNEADIDTDYEKKMYDFFQAYQSNMEEKYKEQ
jgi:hypothetical protein